MSEFDIIRCYFKEKAHQNAAVRVGIGDDAAVLHVEPETELVVATDTLVAGVHFPLNTSPFDIGYKSLAVNLSDLAAMGATPQWMTLALTLPRADEDWLDKFSQGLLSLAEQFNVSLVGGDTTQGPLTISVQIGGVVEKGKALLRSGAQADDLILVTGTLGNAARGLALLQQSSKTIPAEYLTCLNRPVPRVAAGQILLKHATACIDISDGLYRDLSHIAEASGVGAVINVDDIPLSKQLQVDELTLSEKYRLALGGGDDYELCFTIREESLPLVETTMAAINTPCCVIGKMTLANGVKLHSIETSEIIVDTLGYEHFT